MGPRDDEPQEKLMPKPVAVGSDAPVIDEFAKTLFTILICFMLVRLLCWLPQRKKLKGVSEGMGGDRKDNHNSETPFKSKSKNKTKQI